ncbi:MAG: sigma-70 family RNA polymerase sigma factor [Parafilimonas sp.]|nr:sigma-70 family RNA polymerase sigma factor [Parafilimonas sp.]
MQVERIYRDEELIRDLKSAAKMDTAIRFIYNEYYSLLENYVMNNRGAKEDAADIIQETIVAFIEIIEQDKFRGDSSIKSFLFSITRNLWLSELRKRNSAENRNRVFEKGKNTTEQEIIHHLIRREHFNAIQHLFERLGEKCKQLLMLVYYEEMQMSDITEIMPDYQNEQVLRNKKYKCMKQLEQMMLNNEQLRIQLKNALKHAG